MGKYFVSILLILMFLVLPGDGHAKPGKESILQEKETVATLYLTEIHRNVRSGIFAYRFLWIPNDIVSRCEEETPNFCKNLDNCFLYPDAQDCTPDWSSCEKIIRPKCLPFGFTLQNLSKRHRKPPPNSILDTLHYTESTELIAAVKAMGVPDFSKSKFSFQKIENRLSVKARVRWELWSNGENFKILEFLK